MSNKKIILASTLGNALEFYDFTLYGVMTAVLADRYFPGDDPTAKLLFSLAAFAIGFLTRPLGAILFGYIGDTLGRKEALSLSLLLMGIPTFLIGISPDYNQIGLAASILIFACRLLQGLFTGGEYNGAAIFSIEHLGKKYPGLIGAFITSSCVVGAVGATLLGAWTQSPGMPEWAWRMPFVLGGVIGLFGYFVRRNMEETPEFSSMSTKNKISLVTVLLSHPQASLISFSLGCFNGILTYTLFGFLNIFLSRYLQIPLAEAMQFNLIGLMIFMISNPGMGYLMDCIGRQKFLAGAAAIIFGLAYPIFYLLMSNTIFDIALGQTLLGLCVASIAGTGHAVMQNLFPVEGRYRGIAFNFSLGMGICGGIAPIIYVHMIERAGATLLFPAFMIMGSSVLFFAVLTASGFFTKPSTANAT